MKAALLIYFISCVIAAPAQAKKKALIIYGDKIAFSVTEPDGWHCLCDSKVASKLGANAVFVKDGKSPDDGSPLIRIRANEKTDEKIELDMQADEAQYRAQYAGMQFHELKVKHKSYRTVARLFAKEKVFYEYVAYVNPGPKVKTSFSVSMNIQRRQAEAAERKAYEDVLSSVRLVPVVEKKN